MTIVKPCKRCKIQPEIEHSSRYNEFRIACIKCRAHTKAYEIIINGNSETPVREAIAEWNEMNAGQEV